MTSVRIWGPGVGAVVVLVATGAWARGSSAVDAGLWASVRPAIEERLVAQAQGDGPGEREPALEARWFCEAQALDLRQEGDRVRAGVDTLCMEYGVRDGALQECGGAHYPQVMRLAREGEGYRVVAQEEPPDGAGYAQWEKDHFSVFAASRLDGREAGSAGLESAARAHFGLRAEGVVGDC